MTFLDHFQKRKLKKENINLHSRQLSMRIRTRLPRTVDSIPLNVALHPPPVSEVLTFIVDVNNKLKSH